MFTTADYLRNYKPALFNAICGKKEAEEAAHRDTARADELHRRAIEWDYRAKEWAAVIIGRHC